MRSIDWSGNCVVDSLRTVNSGGSTAATSGRMIGFGTFSVLTGLYCAEPCSAALLHVMGAVSAARLASSTLFIAGIAAVSLGWALWRLYRTRRACADTNCPSTRVVWLTAAFTVAAFVVDVSL
jgi:hypothetical protein